MMKRFLSLCAVLALCLVGVSQAQAGVIYSNGPINGNVEAYTINNGFAVSDSFTVLSPTSLGSVTAAGIWTDPGSSPTSLSWAIGTTPNGSDISSGTATPTDTYHNQAYGYYNVWSSSFNINGTILSPGTYYLTLTNATSSDGGYVYWDQNDGPSQAYQYYYGSLFASRPSESFTINSASATPEPASLTLLGLGGLSLVGYGWRRRRQVVTA